MSFSIYFDEENEKGSSYSEVYEDEKVLNLVNSNAHNSRGHSHQSSTDQRQSQSNKGQRQSQTNKGHSQSKKTGYVLELSKDSDHHSDACCVKVLVVISWIFVILFFPIAIFMCLMIVNEYERAVIFRCGRILPGGAKGPGLFFILPCIDTYKTVDLRIITFDVAPQEILTRDSVTVAVDAVVYYRVFDPTACIVNVMEVDNATRLLASTFLRNVLGTKTLAELMSSREEISTTLQQEMDGATDAWGIKVEMVEIKDVRLPIQLQRAMAAEAEAAREAKAKVIAAEGEQKASLALKEAANVMLQSPASLQLRYLQTLNTISAEKNSTIIFPLPMEFMSMFKR